MPYEIGTSNAALFFGFHSEGTDGMCVILESVSSRLTDEVVLSDKFQRYQTSVGLEDIKLIWTSHFGVLPCLTSWIDGYR